MNERERKKKELMDEKVQNKKKSDNDNIINESWIRMDIR